MFEDSKKEILMKPVANAVNYTKKVNINKGQSYSNTLFFYITVQHWLSVLMSDHVEPEKS